MEHPSLPKNYVTLAQLQERWLKHQPQHVSDSAPTSRSINDLKNENDSRTNDRSTVKIASAKESCKSDTDAGGVYLAYKKKNYHSKRRGKNKHKEGNGVAVSKVESEEIEEKIGGLSLNPRNLKQSTRFGRRNKDFLTKTTSSNSGVWKLKSSESEKKKTIEIELNDVKTTPVEAEEVAGLHVSFGNAKQNTRFRRTKNEGFRQSRGFGHFRDQKCPNFRKVWVRKDRGDEH